MKKRIYIAGKMRGIPQYNFPAFRKAAEQWRADGWDVVSPAEMDEAIGFTENDAEPTGDFLRQAMKRDLEAILSCDAIAVIPGWEGSKGVKVEIALAQFLEMPIYCAQYGLPLLTGVGL